MKVIVHCGCGASTEVDSNVSAVTGPETRYRCVDCSADFRRATSVEFQEYAFDPRLNLSTSPETIYLKGVFPRGGYLLKKLRTKKRDVPAWTLSHESIRTVLLKAFPRLQTNPSQRKSAARWAQVIQLYFDRGKTEGQVAEELIENVNVIRCLVARIKATAAKAGLQ